MRSQVITVRKPAAQLIRHILDGAGRDTAEVIAGGPGNVEAVTLAQSLRYREPLPLALVLDARTNDPEFVSEQEHEWFSFARNGMISPNVPFQLFMAVPEVEAVLFHDPPSLERILGRPIPPDALFEAQFRPRVVLQRLLAETDPARDLGWVAERIDAEAACAFAQHPLMRSLIAFLRHPRACARYAEAA